MDESGKITRLGDAKSARFNYFPGVIFPKSRRKMKKQILVYGVVSGAIIIGSIILSLVTSDADSSMAALEWLGYLIMLVALSVIFIAIKRYRDQELGGVIKFGTAFLMGLGISLVASLIYIVTWEAHLAVTDYAFIDTYVDGVIAAKEAEGVTGAELEQTVTEMEELKTQYNNPVFRLFITFTEIFPVGLIVSLISAAVLRNAKVLPANAV